VRWKIPRMLVVAKREMETRLKGGVFERSEENPSLRGCGELLTR